MADTKISNFTDGVTLNATDRIAGARSPFAADSDNVYVTAPYIGTYLAKNTLAAGTITTSQPMILTQTWNAGAVTFNSLLVNVTDTTSAVASTLLDLQVAASTKFNVTKGGNVLAKGTYGFVDHSTLSIADSGGAMLFTVNSNTLTMGSGRLDLASASYFSWNDDTKLFRDAANTLAQRNGTTAQSTRIYTTFTDASNYERLGLNTSSGSYVELAAETAGTGVDNLDVRITPAGTGQLRYSQAATSNSSAATTITNGADSSSNLGHRFSISLNGTTYWVPCSATAF